MTTYKPTFTAVLINALEVINPVVTIASYAFDSTSESFTANSGKTADRVTTPTRFGAGALRVYDATSTYTGVAQGLRTVTGLTIGRSYTVTGWARRDAAATNAGTIRIGVTGKAYGSAIASPSTTYQQASYTFTATATSHQIILEHNATTAATAAASTVYWDDVQVDQNVYSTYTNRPLNIIGGTITLDAWRAPQITASLELSTADTGVVEWLDPRDNRRVSVAVSQLNGTNPTPVTRTFNLGLRDRDVDHAGGKVTILLASDEALLIDYAPIALDLTPALSHQSSLYGICNYVLGTAIPGKSLGSGVADRSFHVLETAENISNNPSFENDLGDWSFWGNGGDATGTRLTSGGKEGTDYYRITWTDDPATPYGGMFHHLPSGSAREYENYIASVWVRPSITQKFRLLLEWYDSDGAHLDPFAEGPVFNCPANTWTRIKVESVAPANTSHADVSVYADLDTGTIWPIGSTVGYDGMMVIRGENTPGIEYTTYFDGDSTDTAEYAYSWTGDPGYSASKRIALNDRAPELLHWQAGQTALDFLANILQVEGLRLVVDEAGNFTLRDEDYEASGSTVIEHAVNLHEGTDLISRNSGEWCDAAVTTYTWMDKDGEEQERQDGYALTIPWTRLKTIEKRAAYPGPGYSEYVVRQAQRRGREVNATASANWATTVNQPATVQLQNAPEQTGLIRSLEFDLTTDRMTLRLLTEES